jgi:hypothetical protein
MEAVLTTPDLQDIILGRLVFRDLNHLRCANKGIQEAVSIYVSKKVDYWHTRFQTRLLYGSEVGDDPLAIACHIPRTIYAPLYAVLYNYYHTILKLDLMVLPEDKPIDVPEFCMSLTHIPTDVTWPTYERVLSWEEGDHLTEELRLNRIRQTEQSLYDIMCHIKLNGECFELTEDNQYLQNKLLPLV